MTDASDQQYSLSLWDEVIVSQHGVHVLTEGIHRAARSLSMMTGRTISIEDPDIQTMPIFDIVNHGGSPEDETVGVYLLIEGELHGQALLLIGVADALYLVDLLMADEPGTAQELDELARSALAEIGNITLAGFLNVVTELTGKEVKPSPPAVVIDMVAAILEMIAANAAMRSDELMLVKTGFKDEDRVLAFRFWVLPDPAGDGLDFS